MPTVTLAAQGPPPASFPVAITYTEAISLPLLTLTGAQTYAIDLAMMPAAGLRGFLVSLDAKDAAGNTLAPVTLRWTANSVQSDHELGAGGVHLEANPTPMHGITALSIVTTGNAILHLFAWG